MGYVDVAAVGHSLPDGRQLFTDVSFRVADGAKVALVGPNGAGKTTLLRMVAGDLPVQRGAIARVGGLGVMRQFIGMIGDESTLADLALSLAPPRLREAGQRVAATEAAMRQAEVRGKYSTAAGKAQLAYAEALAAWGEAGGYDAEVLFDTVTTIVLDLPWDTARGRPVRTLSGGQQKRFALELLLRGVDEVLLLDEPDNFLDVTGKRWLEARLRESGKSVLYVSHDRELLAHTADRVVAVEGGGAWVHPGGFASWHEARVARHDRLDEQRRRWDEEHQKLRELMLMYKQKAAYNSGMASRYQAAQTRLRKFEEAGPPPVPPKEQDIRMQLAGGRTGKRAVICEQVELDGLTYPFDLEIWYGDRVAVLGANGTGKSHFLRLIAGGGTDPDPANRPVDGGAGLAPVGHDGVARLGARVRPGHFSQTHDRPELMERTLVDILWHGDDHRAGMDRHAAMAALSRYELAGQGDQRFGTLSGGQQARFLVLLLELSGATLLLLDEPTDNLDLASAEALEAGLAAFEGTVVAVTHDRWFTRSFDRFVLFRGDGEVVEVAEPVWDAA
ncbi:ATP-binding cassette domain-containing protein [Salinispora arenicola]|uniref:ABC transporter ATP-binding protein n=2 Tax=Salinispora arenicola TaxID=168697 RepID=A0A542XMH8_SALAC|nr:ATP-binding cassette domain-containing protein [Salinispora arenicola]MCN0179722.1 ATP-binding cassette domain-containing protein [Salinispora arenicola]NIL57776.1 ABC-F family ATP-binding cassette domain-containing protein [Salinispora arenicola]TQL37058.1 ATPase subunit of ABC transporter with duplicated ATPase domains [Salinispora arenicola]GIM81988.1 ABC transporter ATP-binding protein [Salinispora arenicola]